MSHETQGELFSRDQATGADQLPTDEKVPEATAATTENPAFDVNRATQLTDEQKAKLQEDIRRYQEIAESRRPPQLLIYIDAGIPRTRRMIPTVGVKYFERGRRKTLLPNQQGIGPFALASPGWEVPEDKNSDKWVQVELVSPAVIKSDYDRVQDDVAQPAPITRDPRRSGKKWLLVQERDMIPWSGDAVPEPHFLPKDSVYRRGLQRPQRRSPGRFGQHHELFLI